MYVGFFFLTRLYYSLTVYMSSSTFVIKVEKRATNDNDDDVDADGIWSLLIWICARFKLDDVDRFHRLLCRKIHANMGKSIIN